MRMSGCWWRIGHVAVQRLSDFPAVERAVVEHLAAGGASDGHNISTVPDLTGGLAWIVCSCGACWMPGQYGPSADYGRDGRFML